MKIHAFKDSLEASHKYADAPWWFEVYRSAFPSMLACTSVRNDGWHQRAGIDRVITLDCSRSIKVDEKVRENDWPDILLERWSDEARRIPGWIQKPLACDYIAYAFVPSQKCYLFDFLTLRRAWRRHGRDWINTCKEVRADNGNYTTVSVAVPTEMLLESVKDAMCISWIEGQNGKTY